MSKYRIGQYFNLEGITSSLSFIMKPWELRPHLRAKSIVELNLKDLKSLRRVKYIVFDKDNTLTLPHEQEFASNNIKEKIDEFKSIFSHEHLAVLSNSAGSSDDIDYKESSAIENSLGLAVIKHKHKKPNVYTEIIDHFRKQSQTTIKSEEICVVGDRLLVDVVMGKKFGFYTILVEPITYKDNFVVFCVRQFESILIKML